MTLHLLFNGTLPQDLQKVLEIKVDLIWVLLELSSFRDSKVLSMQAQLLMLFTKFYNNLSEGSEKVLACLQKVLAILSDYENKKLLLPGDSPLPVDEESIQSESDDEGAFALMYP